MRSNNAQENARRGIEVTHEIGSSNRSDHSIGTVEYRSQSVARCTPRTLRDGPSLAPLETLLTRGSARTRKSHRGEKELMQDPREDMTSKRDVIPDERSKRAG
jgi:hypothetical protein